jgi:serine kinase of HPr protein (carbohydrate metabolism regulator)
VSPAEAVTLIHATCVAVGGVGVLLIGPPGSGKSDLALRLIDTAGFGIGSSPLTAQLVADDQVKLTRIEDHLEAQAPEALAGLLEVRGVGIVRVAHFPSTRVDLAVRLRSQKEIERMPDLAEQRHEVLGISIPLLDIDPAADSAPARIRAAVHHLFSRQ